MGGKRTMLFVVVDADKNVFCTKESLTKAPKVSSAEVSARAEETSSESVDPGKLSAVSREDTSCSSESIVTPVLCDPSIQQQIVEDLLRSSGARSGETTQSLTTEVPQPAASVEDPLDGLILLVEEIPIREAFTAVLKQFSVVDSCWVLTEDETKHVISFTVNPDQTESILEALKRISMGKSINIRVIPLIAYEGPCADEVVEDEAASQKEISEDSPEGDATEDTIATVDKEMLAESAKRANFVDTIKSRLMVGQVISDIESNSAFTFDYLMLLLVAAVIAAMGLLENSTVVLVASMLVSPIMGPILAGVFGSVVKNKKLALHGLKIELLSLAICIGVGFVFGLFTMWTKTDWGSSNQWPTREMGSRGELRSLWVGMLIAIPSGVGVSLSILAGNTGSLVGVAISASLLPPAINTGMLWAGCIYEAAMPSIEYGSNDNVSVYPPCSEMTSNDYTPVYFCDMRKEMALLGFVSLCLTIVNIVCIVLMGVIILKIKEVAPKASHMTQRTFWKKDVRVARECYKTMKASKQTASLAKQLLAEIKVSEFTEKEFLSAVTEAEKDEQYLTVVGMLPQTGRIRASQLYEFKRELARIPDSPGHEGHYKPISTVRSFSVQDHAVAPAKSRPAYKQTRSVSAINFKNQPTVTFKKAPEKERIFQVVRIDTPKPHTTAEVDAKSNTFFPSEAASPCEDTQEQDARAPLLAVVKDVTWTDTAPLQS